eukprot:scaffold9342_cov126-Isochrysis_galbana.AAC.8
MHNIRKRKQQGPARRRTQKAPRQFANLSNTSRGPEKRRPSCSRLVTLVSAHPVPPCRWRTAWWGKQEGAGGCMDGFIFYTLTVIAATTEGAFARQAQGLHPPARTVQLRMPLAAMRV